jgi:hypothetical protein
MDLEFRRYYEGEEEWKKNGIGTQRTILIESSKMVSQRNLKIGETKD